jgi:transposase
MSSHADTNNAGTELAVGIDVAKATLVVAVWDGADQHGQVLGTFNNTDDGCEALAKCLEHQQAARNTPAIHITLEPTAGYEARVVYFAHRRGWRVSLVNPEHARDWARSLGQRAKTDQLDALALARLTAERGQALRLWTPPHEAVAELDSLLSRLTDLKQLIQQERNRLHSFSQRPTTAPRTLQSVQAVLAVAEAELADIESAIHDVLKRHPPMREQAQRLDDIPGVGKKTLPPLLLALLHFDHLTAGQGTSKQLTAFVGFDPVKHTSGTSVHKPSFISKHGNPALRATLFMAALGAIRGHNPIRQFYDALVARGKRKMVALVACAHKILTWAWAIFKSGQPFDPSRFALAA